MRALQTPLRPTVPSAPIGTLDGSLLMRNYIQSALKQVAARPPPPSTRKVKGREDRDDDAATIAVKYRAHLETISDWCRRSAALEGPRLFDRWRGFLKPEGRPIAFVSSLRYVVTHLEKVHVSMCAKSTITAVRISGIQMRDVVQHWLTCPIHHTQSAERQGCTISELLFLSAVYSMAVERPELVNEERCLGSNVVIAMSQFRQMWIGGVTDGMKSSTERMDIKKMLLDMAAFTVMHIQRGRSKLLDEAERGKELKEEVKHLTLETKDLSTASKRAEVLSKAVSAVKDRVASVVTHWLTKCSLYATSLLAVEHFLLTGSTEGPAAVFPDELRRTATFVSLRSGLDKELAIHLEKGAADSKRRIILRDMIHELNLPVGATDDQLRNPDAVRLDYGKMYREYIGVTESLQMDRRLDHPQVSQWYRGATGGPIDELKDSQSMTNDAIVVTMYTFAMKSAVDSCHWDTTSLVTPATFRAAYSTLGQKTRDGRPRTPMVVIINGGFYVHWWVPTTTRSVLSVAVDARDAIAIWLFLMSANHASTMENGLDIGSRWIDHLINL
jgi:hypothetical protein